MSVEDIDVYRELQEHMDQMPIGFPATRSGIELRILKRLFTPEEAKIATKLRYSAEITEPLESIYERVKEIGISIGELEKILDNMVKKGTLLYKKEGDKKYYANALLAVGIAEFQLKSFDKEFL
ncbi:MAG: 4Fe-4S ferredoxin, partial [Candidatus Helarchaeota archaeon]|nr:4Fe-4S ferredoxin [Candidatus Helarchaeota archaeon]